MDRSSFWLEVCSYRVYHICQSTENDTPLNYTSRVRVSVQEELPFPGFEVVLLGLVISMDENTGYSKRVFVFVFVSRCHTIAKIMHWSKLHSFFYL